MFSRQEVDVEEKRLDFYSEEMYGVRGREEGKRGHGYPHFQKPWQFSEHPTSTSERLTSESDGRTGCSDVGSLDGTTPLLAGNIQ
jgi:hypothetical protein